jgi:glycosyltransferase involved in cell wall biosynthesis
MTGVPRRLLLVYSGFGPYHLARWRTVRSQMADRGWEVVPVEILARQDRYDWGDDAGDGDIVRLGFQSDGRDQIRWRDAGRLLRAIASLRPDVVAVNGWALRDSILLHLWCRARGIARIVVTDSTADDSARSSLKELVKRVLLRHVGAAFAAGTASRRYVASLSVPEERITLGCDVVDNRHFARPHDEHGPRSDGIARLLTVARFVPEKNLLAAAAAFLEVAARNPGEVQWTIVGYGPLEVELRRIAECSNGSIQLLGRVSTRGMPALLHAADVLWLPSIIEPWGLVVNEAMAAGVPVAVSMRVGCHEDLVDRLTGWTFDPTSLESLVDGLERVLADRERWLEMGVAAAARVAEWDLDRFIAGLLAAADRAIEPVSARRSKRYQYR